MVSDVTADEALARMRPEDRALVEEFRESVREILGPRLRDLRLFGSKARGDDDQESDIDVLVLVDSLDPETRQGIVDLSIDIGFTPGPGPRTFVSPAIADFDEYHKPRNRASGFYDSMRRESIRL